MSSNRQIIFNYLKKYSITAQASMGLSTQYLSEKLDIQRANVSRILNQLVKEGLVDKTQGRPVLYRLKNNESHLKEKSCFNSLIGYDGSLKNCVQLAKAAMLYPQRCLRTIICGPSGCGKYYFAKLMYMFAKENGVLKSDAPFIHLDCSNYADDDKLIQDLFNKNGEGNLFEKAREGVMLIEHIELMPARVRSILLEYLAKDNEQSEIAFICTCNDDVPTNVISSLSNQIPVRINMNSYNSKKMEERLMFVRHFFLIESACVKRSLHINAELLHCLLMYECKDNIKQLKRDIRMGTANAYVREFDSEKDTLTLTMSDFPEHVRKGILNYKAHRKELQALIPENFRYIFSDGDIQKEELDQEGYEDTIYDIVNRKVKDLNERGLSRKDISMIINADMENEFKKYSTNLTKQVVNIDELSKVVSEKLIYMVSDFLDKVSFKCERIFSDSILYGLCLHLHSTILRTEQKQQLKSSQIAEVVKKYPVEYALSVDFVSSIEEEYNTQLPIDEVVFITMFLCDKFYENEYRQRPVLLIAMHGNSSASSISTCVNDLLKETIAYSFDLPLHVSPQEGYDLLKKTMLEIDRGSGIIFMYDMGSLKFMSEMIAQEMGISIELIEMPVTLLALDYARKCLMGRTLDEVVSNINTRVILKEGYYQKNITNDSDTKAIITLCMSGQGGAVQMKQYIEEVLDEVPVNVIPLAISNNDELLKEINKIRKTQEICCVVGTFNPNIYPYTPFVSVSSLFGTERKKLKKLLHLHHKDYLREEGFFDYLNEQLHELDMRDIHKLLPDIINQLELLIDEDFSQDQCVGLFIHIACNINRSVGKQEPIKNSQTVKIQEQYPNLFEDIKKAIKPLEKKFRIRMTNDEIASILSYMKKI